MGDQNNVRVGAFSVSLNGVDIGFTTEAGVTMANATDAYQVKADQSLLELKEFRTGIAKTITLELIEFTLDLLELVFDLSTSVVDEGGGTSSLIVTVKSAIAEVPLILTGPGRSGKTLTYTTTVRVQSVGDITFKKGEESRIPLTLKEVGNAATNTFGTWTEATADTTAPTVTLWDPLSGATGVAVASDIEITFSEDINSTTVTTDNFLLIDSTDGAEKACVLTYSAVDKKVTMNPTTNMTALTKYIVVVSEDVKDLSGNALAATATNYFTTGS